MVAAVLFAFASFLNGSWVEFVHDADLSSQATDTRDHLTRPDAPGAQLLSFPGLDRPDAPQRAAWLVPPASSLPRPDSSPSRESARSGQLGAPGHPDDGLGAPETRQRLLDSLVPPDSGNASLVVPDPELHDEPLLQRPRASR